MRDVTTVLSKTKETGLYGEFFTPVHSGILFSVTHNRFRAYVSERGRTFPSKKQKTLKDAEQDLRRLRRYHGMTPAAGSEITSDFLSKRFSYSPVSGEFRRRTAFKDLKVGSVAGYRYHMDDHRMMKVAGSIYPAHRLAWLYHYGEMPCFLIHHKNGDLDNNSINNLVPMVSEL